MIKKYYLLQQEAPLDTDGAAAIADETARLSSPDGSYQDADDNDGGDSNTDKPIVKGATELPKEAEVTFTPSSDWESLKSLEGFEMPKDISAENEKELLKPWIAKKYDIKVDQPVLHPLAKQIQDMAQENPNISINDLVNDVSSQYVDASKMNTEQKIEFDLYSRYGIHDAEKNPDGLTKEDIREYLEKMTKIEKGEAAKVIDQNIEAYNKSLTEKFQQERQAQYEANYEDIKKTLDNAFGTLRQNLTKVETVYGIPVSQEDHDSYMEEFKKLSIPDKATGERGLDVILSDDVTLYKMFLLATKFGEDKVIELITKGREASKEEILKKLKLTPTFKGSQQRETGHSDLASELDALRRPSM